MSDVGLRDAKTGFSGFVDQAMKGEFVTITRHGKPVAALVSLEAAEIARRALGRKRPGLVSYLKTIPDHDAFDRNSAPPRDPEL
ncbi:type II toxin-antitoxin system Phd/YefM family antitoxin [Jiella sp. M17.18]|uniref:type II toxin-antitoxin system Phd/YefM family antitoxin n=1 Tax=Jiella sp. M17.18 TaxID=3234247 RepID=UPI0034DE0EB6